MFGTQTYFWWLIIGLFSMGGLIPLVAALLRLKLVRVTVATNASLWLALVGSGLITFYAVNILVSGVPTEATLLPQQDFVGGLPAIALNVYIDRLSAFFLLLIGGLSFGISVYSFVYLRQIADRAQIAGGYNLFVLSEVLFVIASNVFFFILLLECATLTCGFLVLHKHYEQPDVREHQQAIKTYMIANHIGGVLVLAALLLLALSHNPATFNMSIFRQLPNVSNAIANNLVFLLAFIGFGIKAGVAPFHIWVSIAHPNLPANTHAISVGIMIKVALYGMIRVFFQFLHPIPWWWGFTVLLIAALTALIGVRNALYGRTLKDSFADHSVENIGIILAGIGLALLFASNDLPQPPILHSLVGLALVAGLYHLLNHTVFKGLLNLCTGAIEYLTGGVVELKRLGGLIHHFPWTSACFLIGSVAIAGFPPFNGFISEWLTLQTLITGMSLLSNNWLLLSGIVLSVLLLASAFALTALAFVKIVGEALLGKPRDETLLSAYAKNDVPWHMRGILLILAILCLMLGIFPGLVIIMLGMIVRDLGFSLTSSGSFSLVGGVTINIGKSYSANLPAAFLFALLGLVIFVFLIAVRASRRSRGAKAVWTGGTRYNPSIMQYTSSVFTSPMRDFLGKTLTSVLFISITQSPILKRLGRVLTRRTSTFEASSIKTHFELSGNRSISEPFRQVYNGVINLLQSFSRSIGSFFQNGDLRSYLLYIFIFFITVFIILTGLR